jgi:hypothetical protein
LIVEIPGSEERALMFFSHQTRLKEAGPWQIPQTRLAE